MRVMKVDQTRDADEEHPHVAVARSSSATAGASNVNSKNFSALTTCAPVLYAGSLMLAQTRDAEDPGQEERQSSKVQRARRSGSRPFRLPSRIAATTTTSTATSASVIVTRPPVTDGW